MIPSKGKVGMLVVMCIGMMMFSVQAQEGPAYMYFGEKAKQAESDSMLSDTIYTGKVIVYGELLKPPYIVQLERDTIWINGISVNPRIKTFEEEPRVFQISAYDSLRFVRDTSIVRKFKRFVPLYGDKKTMEMLREKYLPDSIVSDLHFKIRSGIIQMVQIKHSDGTEANYTGLGERDENGGIKPVHSRRNLTIEDSRRLKKSSFRAMINYLRDGGLLVISLGGEAFIRRGDQNDLIMNTLSRVAKGELTVTDAKKMFPKSGPFGKEFFWKEFQLKEYSWK